MTQAVKPADPKIFFTVGLIIGLVLSVMTANIDLICLPDLASAQGTGKLQGILNTFAMALDRPVLFFPLLFGFSCLGIAVVLFPLLFANASAGRQVAALGIIMLLLGGVGYGAYLLPRANCDGTWQGLRVLLQIGTAVIMWFIVVLLCFRKDRRATS